MMRSLLILALFLQAAFLFADPPVGRSLGKEVRVRSHPETAGELVGALGTDDEVIVMGRSSEAAVVDGKTAYWLRVAGVGGISGWVFGGYLDTGSADLAALDALGSEPDLVFVDIGSSLGAGAVATRCELRSASGGFAGLLVKFPGRPAAVVFALGAEGSYVKSIGVAGVEFRDVLGDTRKEVLVELDIVGKRDDAVQMMEVYGILPGAARFSRLGMLTFSYTAFDKDGRPTMFVTRVSGPEAAVVRGRRVIQVVLKEVSVGVAGADAAGATTTTTVKAYLYALEGASMPCVETRELERSVGREP